MQTVYPGRRGVPGVVRDWVGAGEGYTGTQPTTVPGPIFNIFKV